MEDSNRPPETLRIEQLEQQVARLSEQLEATQALQQAALDMTSQLDVPELLDTVVQQASSLVNATGGAVYLRPAPDSPYVEVIVSHNLDRDYRGTRLSLGEGIGGRVVQSGQPLIMRDYQQWPGKAPHLQSATARGVLAIPLTSRGHTHGALEIIDLTGERVFTTDDLNFLMPFALQVATAVENVLLYQEERRQRGAANALREAAEIIGRSLDLDQILILLLDQLERLVLYDSSTIQLLKDGSLRVVAVRGFAPDVKLRDIAWANIENEIWQTILRAKEPLIIPDVREDPRWEVRAGLEYIRSWIGIPIVTRDWVWGVLTLNSAEPHFYGRREADLAATVARYAATAIENAQLYTSAHHLSQVNQTRVAQLNTLQATNLRLSSTLELEAALRTLAEGALELTPADDTHIYFYDQDTGELAFGTALWRDGRREPAVVAPRPKGLTATVARQGKPVIIEDALRHPLFSDQVARQWGVHATAGFPLKRQERVIGVFNLTYLSPHSFSPDEVRILNLLADQAAVAIENAQLYQQVQAHRERLEAEVTARIFQLRQEKERADVILTHAADGVMLTDARGVIEYVNPSWERLTGYTAQQTLGQIPTALKSGAKASPSYAEMWETIMAGQPWRGQLRDHRADGSPYDVDLTIAPVLDAEGQIVNLVGVHRDITALKEVERLKDEFVSNVSHELRTPIANLKLYQSLLQRGKPERREAYLQVIARETARLEQLVTDLLDLSRLDRGAITLVPELLDLNGLAADVVNRLLGMAQERRVTLELTQAPHLPSAWLDMAKMTQVLTNLVVNALNYTLPDGQVMVETGQETWGNRPGVCLIVQDTGIGIAPSDQERVFERFFRAQGARDGRVPGTGLGLAIVKEIVELHDGQIQVQSELGQGSTFKVWLPLS
jgi:PAS domain S-box-containing protein